MNNISKERLVTHLVTDFNFTLCKSFNTSDIERTGFGFSAVVDSAYKGKYKFKSTSSGTEPLVKKHNWCRILKNWTQKLSVHSFISKSFWIDVLPSTPVRREVNDHWFDGFHVEHRMHRHLRRTICALIEPKKWNHVLFSKQWLKQPRDRFYPGLILSRDFQTNVSTTINATRCTDAKCVDHKFLMKSDGKQATINQERLETQPTASTHWAVAWSGNECRNEGFHRFFGKKMHHTSSQLAFWRCINNPLTINLRATKIGQSSVSCGTWCGTRRGTRRGTRCGTWTNATTQQTNFLTRAFFLCRINSSVSLGFVSFDDIIGGNGGGGGMGMEDGRGGGGGIDPRNGVEVELGSTDGAVKLADTGKKIYQWKNLPRHT